MKASFEEAEAKAKEVMKKTYIGALEWLLVGIKHDVVRQPSIDV